MPDGMWRSGLVLASLGVLAPLFALPAPVGFYPVGTATRTLDGAHPIGLQLWYPARNVAAAQRAHYRYADPGASLRDRFVASLIGVHAYLDADVASGAFPVLLYVPAWGGTRGDNTALAESLASHGFVVVAMDDLYPQRPMDLSTEHAYHASLRWADEKVHLQAVAAQHVLDALSDWNAADPAGRLRAHLRLDRVGAFGFSFGGAVAAELATLDPRVTAAANMDGWLFGAAAKHGVPKPFLNFSSTGPPVRGFAALLDREDDAQTRAGLERYGGFLVTISGTDHLNFSDVPFYPSFRHTGVGSIAPSRCFHIVDTYVRQFFEHELARAAAPAFRAARPFDSAVRLERWPAPAANPLFGTLRARTASR